MPEVYSISGEAISEGRLLSVRALFNRDLRYAYRLLVDTGATHTALLPEIIQSFQLPEVGVGEQTAAGVPQATEITLYRLDSLIIGHSTQALEITDLEVIALEWPRELGVHGLLGMNWLSRFPRVCLDLITPALELHEDP